jgi:hypothetical protein
MVWTAAINSSGNEIVITRNSEGVDYRSDSYPLGHLQCRKWVENTRNYLALILLERNEVVITITDDPASPSLGNTLLGSASPVVAYTSFTALSASGSSSSPADAAAIETATNTAAANTLAAAANVTLGSILGELAKEKSFADLIVQDTAGTAFIRREVLNSSTNLRTIEIENFDGTVGAPVGVLLPIKQLRGDSVLERSYYAKVAGVGYLEGQSLSNVRVVDGETKAIANLGWFNVTTQSPIAAPPVADIAGYEDLLEELVAAILAKLPTTLGAKLSSQSLAVTLPTDLALPLPTNAAKETTQVSTQAANLAQLQAANLALGLLGTQATLLEVKALSALIFDNTLIPEIRPLTSNDVVSVVLPPSLTVLLNEIKANTTPRFLDKATDSTTVETAQLPASLGQRTAAQSLAVALASDTALPLPAGAATALKQEEEILALEAIGASVALAATESTLQAVKASLGAIETNTLTPNIRPLTPATDGVKVESTTLATIAKQDEQKTLLTAIDNKLGLTATESTQLAVRDKLLAIETNTLAPNIRPLTPAVDAVRVESATLATTANQDTANTALAAIQSSAALVATAALQTTTINKLDLLLVELSKQKEFEDLLVQDTAGTVFIRREQLDESTNQRFIAIENFDGTTGAPVGAVTTVKQIKSNSIVTRNYYAKTAGLDFAAGDSLATMQIVNGETTAVTLLGWFNITQQTSIAAPPTAAIEGYEDLIQELLAQIVAQLPPSLGSKLSAQSLSVVLGLDATIPLPTGAATETSVREFIDTLGILTDISIPADELAEATLKGLLRLVAKRLSETAAQQLAAIGDAAETDALSEPKDFGSLKAVLRGQWEDLRGLIGDQATDPTTVKALLRELGNILTLGTQYTQLLDANTGNRVQILNSGVAATTEPALVVAVSPTTPVLIGQMPGTMQADLAALKVSAETIATNTANISRYQFNLAETTAGLVFLVRTDGVSGATTTINIATGLAFAPGSIELTDVTPASTAANTKTIEPNEFLAKTNSTGQWAVDDILTRVLIVDTATNTSTTIWQGATGVLLTSTPVMGVDVEDTTKTQLNLLKAQPIAGTPVTTEALPTGSGIYGWLSYIRSTLAGVATNVTTLITNTTVPNIRPLTAADTVTVVLPGTAATAANQAVGNATLVTMLARTPILGQKTGANSSPVVLASDVVIPTVISDAGGVAAAIKAANTASVNTDNALTITTRPDSTIAVSALPGTIQADIAAIKANTARISPYQFQFLEDSSATPLVFVARWDTATGTVTNLTLSGSIYTPVLPVRLSDPVTGGSAGLSIEVNEYEAATTNGSNWTINDVLTRVLIVNTTTNAITSTIWQSATGTTLSTIPVIGIDVIDTDKQQLALLRALPVAGTPVTGETLATGSGVFGWLSRIASKIQTGSQLLAGTIATSGVRQVTSSFTTNALNNNVLDATGAGNPLDVVNYNSCQIIITTASAAFVYELITSNDAALGSGTINSANWIDSTGVQVSGIGTIAAGQTAKFTVNLTNVGFLVLRQNTLGIGVTVALTMSQAFDSQRAVIALNPAQSLGAVASVGAVLDSTATVVIGGTGGVVTLSNLNGRNTATFAITGSWTGFLQVQVSLDGTNWSVITTNHILNLLTKTFQLNQITANGIYQTQITGFAFVRLVATSWVAGSATTLARASIANLSVAIEGAVSASISNTNLLIRSDSNSTSSDLNSTITTTTSSITFNQTWGVSRAAEINVTAIAAGTTYTVEWQEPLGAGWRTVYRFTPITVAGVYRSPLLPNTNGSWRYLETIAGATPSVTRSITRTQSNLDVAQAIVPNRTGGFNPLNAGFDLPLYGRTRRIVATNRTATLYFLQVHDSAITLTLGAVPLAAEVYQLPSNSTLPFTVADLGPHGTLFGVNPRLVLSTTFATYTPLSAVAAGQISLFVESI